ncbi:MAG: hypothetical protein PHQ90_00990 [Sulfuricurvum sp.]|uniref:hypothetical protein n=1 Tax=Sulfuricurvum sp. TaxID=2025608 RepID=UPI002622ABBD|nr:hypothetical protein [Sulfuricurvum sp.]MDD2367842.1 hypothetical protein [Sulfuricurvum sp.]MDD2949209.1 hypothetical protein [Sulfuricurvum sp.]MDD5117212.1 hypothetical protein [Sulfuricurvum sp.]
MNKLIKFLALLNEIRKLPRVTLIFMPRLYNNEQETKTLFDSFIKPHPKYKIVQNKELGVSLIHLQTFRTCEEYLASINGKNSASYYARKAKNRHYRFSQIDRNSYLNDIFDINTSAPERQGKKMSSPYCQKSEHLDDKTNYKYFGVIDANGKLRSYCYIGYYGNFAIVSQLLGHKEYLNDGIMYLMMSEIVCELIKEQKVPYLMYDTFYGAGEGLKLFKQKLGFVPYRVRWKYDDQKTF